MFFSNHFQLLWCKWRVNMKLDFKSLRFGGEHSGGKKRTRNVWVIKNGAWHSGGEVYSELVAKNLNEMQVSD